MRLVARSPYFDRATDPMVMRRLFSHESDRFCSAEERLIEVDVPRVFPRSSDTLTIQYRLRIENVRSNTQRTLLLCGTQELGISNRASEVTSQPEDSLSWPELRLTVALFPYDPKLKALRTLCDPVAGLEYIAKHSRDLGWECRQLRSISYEILGYRLERRAVLRLRIAMVDSAGGPDIAESVIVKIVRPDKIERSLLAQESVRTAFRSNTGDSKFTVPSILAVDLKHGVYFMDDIPGSDLCALTGNDDFVRGCRQTQRLLDVLHNSVNGNWPLYTGTNEIEELKKKLEMLGSLFPEHAAKGATILSRLRDLKPATDADFDTCTIHRDFYDKQLIVNGESVALLDFDNLATGDRAQDYGNFLGHCRLRQLQEPHNLQNISDGAIQFIAAGDKIDEIFDSRVAWWQAATLLRLGIIYLLRPRWRDISEPLFDAAAERLQFLESNPRNTYAKSE